MSRDWWRILRVAVAFAGLAMVPLALTWADLPDPAATHWGLDRLPDAYLPRGVLPLLPLALLTLGLAVAGLFRDGTRPSAEGAAFLALLGTMGVLTTVSTVALNRGAASWDQAAPIPWSHILSILVLPFAAAVVGYRIGRRWFPLEPREPSDAEAFIEVGSDEVVTWTGTCRVRYPFVIAGLATVVFVVVSAPLWRLTAAVFMVVGLLLSHVRATVNDFGLRARLGGVFRRSIPLADMESAHVIDLNPGDWGGWGYRMAPGRAAMVLRSGEAIEVVLLSGRRFAVTVNDAATGAGLINGLLERSARAG